MLLNNKSKNIIKEKLKQSIKAEDELKFKTVKNPDSNIDDVYTFKYTNQERSENLSNNLPYNTEISGWLPGVNSLVYGAYNNLKKEYYYNFKLRSGSPEFETATIVIYKVNNFATIPFLMFLLYESNNSLAFIERTAENVEEISKFVETHIFSETEEYTTYQGYKIIDGKYYLFYEIESSEPDEVTEQDGDWVWATLPEIINTQSVFNKPILKSVVELFIKYNELTRLTKEDDMVLHEVPIICYYKCHQSRVNYISKFGAIRETPSKTKGPYYYFSTLFKPLIDSKTDSERIFRFVIFSGKTYLTTNNHINDTDLIKKYNSLIVSESSDINGKQDSQHQPQHPSLLGLSLIKSERNKTITSKYNSATNSPIFFGYSYKTMPSVNKCLIVVKQLEQQIPLSIYKS